MSYYFSKTLHISFDRAIAKVTESLQQSGFGILTEIDVQATMMKKLKIDMQSYKILGACNPAFAYQALQIEDKIGTMLPCNVVVQQTENGVEIAAIDPVASMQAVENPTLKEISEQVRVKLEEAIDRLED
ncbi:DUF302 domain-containing protein [Chamaesiphon minutus]|uniref:DUF302 domain-containing protein n=1 Tax=Chamaesiphon minutus (strain ATCC 27169 / PCC 6605) TaxID=1173020 RepID=K9UPB1_CHAP6|nr:DUF302 domain-containing protein [Chamaesiphon minutus]AFY96927.1 hypothetical protein Cha6605_6091 [Chamaesiphon minutus PCC 6605]